MGLAPMTLETGAFDCRQVGFIPISLRDAQLPPARLEDRFARYGCALRQAGREEP